MAEPKEKISMGTVTVVEAGEPCARGHLGTEVEAGGSELQSLGPALDPVLLYCNTSLFP